MQNIHKIKIPNKKQPFIEIFKGDAWITQNQYKTLCKMLKCKKEMIHVGFDTIKNLLTTKQQDAYINYKQYTYNDVFSFKQLIIDLKAAILSGTRHEQQLISNLLTTENINENELTTILNDMDDVNNTISINNSNKLTNIHNKLSELIKGNKINLTRIHNKNGNGNENGNVNENENEPSDTVGIEEIEEIEEIKEIKDTDITEIKNIKTIDID